MGRRRELGAAVAAVLMTAAVTAPVASAHGNGHGHRHGHGHAPWHGPQTYYLDATAGDDAAAGTSPAHP